MKFHEREYFISLIRCGTVYIEKDNIELEVRPITIEQSLKSFQLYRKSYDKAFTEELMTEEDLDSWMAENELWTFMDDKTTENINKDIEKLKVEAYNSRNNTKILKSIKAYIKAANLQLSSHLNKKYMYYSNTCEGVASNDRLSWIIENTTYLNNKLYNFKNLSIEYVVHEFQSSFLSESNIRELARNEPWRSIWTTRENSGLKLFNNPENTDLTFNQRNLLVWSQIYDNIQESVDCPDDVVIQDDDMLDGWFILQRKKREKEKLEKQLDDTMKNDKIKNSKEVFLVASNEKDIELIDSLNDPMTMAIKKQRENFVKNKGYVDDHMLPDQQLNIQMQANNQMRSKHR